MNLPKTSFAMIQTAPRRLEPMDIPLPDISEDAGLMRIDACGICGSDYEQFEGVLRTPMPVIPGHEPLGVIAKIGDRAAQRWGVDVGDRVAVETMLSCRFCEPCLAGRYHLCRARRIYSYIPLSDEPGLWGSYAQYMFVAPNSIVGIAGVPVYSFSFVGYVAKLSSYSISAAWPLARFTYSGS